MDQIISRVSQVGIIVADIEEAKKNFEKYLGVTEWDCFDGEHLPPLLVDEKPGKLNIKGAITTFPDRFEIELIEPTGEGPYMDHLREHGPGVHHFAIITGNKNDKYQDMMNLITSEGKHPWIHARQADCAPGEGMDFTYLDLRNEMGSIVEIYNEPKD